MRFPLPAGWVRHARKGVCRPADGCGQPFSGASHFLRRPGVGVGRHVPDADSSVNGPLRNPPFLLPRPLLQNEGRFGAQRVGCRWRLPGGHKKGLKEGDWRVAPSPRRGFGHLQRRFVRAAAGCIVLACRSTAPEPCKRMVRCCHRRGFGSSSESAGPGHSGPRCRPYDEGGRRDVGPRHVRSAPSRAR